MAWLGRDRVSNTLDWDWVYIYECVFVFDIKKMVLYYGDSLAELFMSSGRSVWSTVSVGINKHLNTMDRHDMFWKRVSEFNFTQSIFWYRGIYICISKL